MATNKASEITPKNNAKAPSNKLESTYNPNDTLDNLDMLM
jgi:hypothetical protein